MDNVKISRELQLEEAELRRLQSFLSDAQREQRIRAAYQFGLLHLATDTANNNFRIQAGTNPSTLKLTQFSYAVDKLGNVIKLEQFDNLEIPQVDKYYWLGVRHKYSPLEPGKCAIDNNGNVTGVGTSFTQTLRGLPNYPSVITFPDSLLNTGEYEVMEVLSNTDIIIAGAYQPEVEVQFAVVGTFTPGIPIPQDNKVIFQYDSGELIFFEEPSSGNPPNNAAGVEFLLARIKKDAAGVVTIEDKREEYYQTQADFDALNVPRESNPIIGVESVRFDEESTVRTNNLVRLGWGISSNNWTYNTSLNLLTLNAASGGLLKTTDDFVNGSFDGWRVILTTGRSAKVISSVKAGNQINLTLDSMLVQYFPANYPLSIVPPAHFIQIQATPVNGTESSPTLTFLFPVENTFGLLSLPVFVDQAIYALSYCYKVGAAFSPYLAVNALDSDSIGYLRESSYSRGGALKPVLEQIRIPMQVNKVVLTAPTDSYSAFQKAVITGDKFGVTRRSIDNSNPIINLTVGRETVVQIIEGVQVATVDQIINLRMDAGSVRSGNSFTVYFQNDLTLNGNNFYITQNYSGTGDPTSGGSRVLLELREFEMRQAKAGNLAFKFEFDGTNWNVFKQISAIEIVGPDRRMDSRTNIGDRPINYSTILDSTNTISQITTAPGANRDYLVNFCCDVRRVYGFNAKLHVMLYLDGVEIKRLGFCAYQTYDGANEILSFSHLATNVAPSKDFKVVFVNLEGGNTNKMTVGNATLIIDGNPSI